MALGDLISLGFLGGCWFAWSLGAWYLFLGFDHVSISLVITQPILFQAASMATWMTSLILVRWVSWLGFMCSAWGWEILYVLFFLGICFGKSKHCLICFFCGRGWMVISATLSRTGPCCCFKLISCICAEWVFPVASRSG